MYRDQLLALLEEATEDAPYRVEPTEQGLDVTINIVDTEYYTLLYKQGVKKIFTHHVAVDEQAGTYTITDDSYTVSWRAGVDTEDGIPQPQVSGTAQRQAGSSLEFSFRKTWAFDEQGRYGLVEDWTFSSQEGKRFITTAADRLGLQRTMDTASKLGLVVAVLGLLVAVGAVVFAAILGG